MEQSKQNTLLVPGAIIVAGALIAGAVFLNGGNSDQGQIVQDRLPVAEQPSQRQETNTDAVRPVTEEDHIRGDINAPVKIVEYSDFECPFCKRVHETMKQVMDKYGDTGQVAWIYRQFPLESLHPVKAMAEAVASECAAELGGNDAFWAFADRFFELTPSNNRTDLEVVIPQIVGEIGLDQGAFNECMNSGRYDQHIQDDIDNAVATGGRGTPWSIVIAPNGQTIPLNGAQPYSSFEQIIEAALRL